MKTATVNFDCADIYQEHAFLVRLTKGRGRQVQVFEVFGRLPTEREAQWAPETILRCEAPREIWDFISPEARSEFNRRLKAEGKPAGGAGVPTRQRCSASSARSFLSSFGRSSLLA